MMNNIKGSLSIYEKKGVKGEKKAPRATTSDLEKNVGEYLSTCALAWGEARAW